MSVRRRWWWIRHAPVAAPYRGRINGQLDVPADLGDTVALAGIAWQLPSGALWLTSNLARAADTAAALHPPKRPIVEPSFAEQHFGDWQELSWDDIGSTEAEAFWQDPVENIPPGGESFAAMAARVRAAIRKWDVQADQVNDIIVVAHAGPIRAAASFAQNMPLADALALDIAPLSLTRFNG